MTTIMPQNELVRKAVAWIGTEARDRAGVPLNRLIEEAGRRFNLSPLEVETLQRFFKDNPNHRPDAC